MLVATLLLSCVGSPEHDTGAIIGQAVEALRNSKEFEASVEGDVTEDGKPVAYSAHLFVSRDPVKYWCRCDSTDGTEYAALLGTKLTYTDNGKRAETDAPTSRIVVNYASSVAIYAWDTLCDLDRYRDAGPRESFYVHEEEIDGHRCDLIGLVKSATSQGETRSSIRFLWIDRQSGLPRAFQVQSFVRGQTALGPKWTIASLKTASAKIDDLAAEIPAVSATAPPKPIEESSVVFHAGDACLPLAVEKMDGKQLKLPSLIHGKTLVTFWASWCTPCRAELDALVQNPDVKAKRLNVVAIGVDDSKQNLRGFAVKGSPLIHYFMDPYAERQTSSFHADYAPTGIPHAYLYDANGKLIREWLGFSNALELTKELSGG